jgi:hypothetical protein
MNVREMRDADLDEVIALLERALGPAPGGVARRDLFAWKHQRSHFGRSIALVAEESGDIVGLRTFLRWRFAAGGAQDVEAVRAVDTATDPRMARRGVFRTLTMAGLELCGAEDIGFVFNTPNAKSKAGYLKMGWSEVTTWPVSVRIRRPLSLAASAVRRDLSSGPGVDVPGTSALRRAADALADPSVIALVESLQPPAERLSTRRTPGYLRWRYAGGPIAYHALTVGQPPEALVMLRARSRGRLHEAVICEALAGPGSVRALRTALRRAGAAAGAHHAVAHFGEGLPGHPALLASGYLRLPGRGMAFTARPVAGAALDPLAAEDWALSLGDLEVF